MLPNRLLLLVVIAAALIPVAHAGAAPAGLPNLRVSSASAVRAGDQVVGSFSILNAGQRGARPTSAAVAWLHRGGGWHELLRARVVGIGPGQGRAQTFSFRIPDGAEGGAYRVRVCADADRQVVESDEGDNCGDAGVIALPGPPPVRLPDTSIDGAPSGVVAVSAATVSFSADEPGAVFQCSLDSGAWARCESPLTLADLTDGAHAFEVRAQLGDVVDATPARAAWVVDTTPPESTILGGPTGLTNVATADISFAASEPGTTDCALDGAAFGPCTSPVHLLVGDGPHNFMVRATDVAGNVEGAPAIINWSVDTVPPQTGYEGTPLEGVLGSTTASLLVVSSEPGSTIDCLLDGSPSPQGCGPFTGLAEGPHTLQATATDPAGNTDLTPLIAAWIVDLTPPETEIVKAPTQPADWLVPVEFDFASNEPATFECDIDGEGYQPCPTPQLIAVGPGMHVISVRAVDRAGHVDPTPATSSWEVLANNGF